MTHDSNFSIRGKKKSSHTLPYNCFNIGRSGKKIKEGRETDVVLTDIQFV